MIRVLIVEDSPVVRDFLWHLLSSNPEIQVIGTASDGDVALDAVHCHKPDFVPLAYCSRAWGQTERRN